MATIEPFSAATSHPADPDNDYIVINDEVNILQFFYVVSDTVYYYYLIFKMQNNEANDLQEGHEEIILDDVNNIISHLSRFHFY